MKKFLLAVLLPLALPAASSAQVFDSLWNEANTAYINARYADAIEDYEAILAQGAEGENLYYNLGNAYFKSGMNAQAILNYNKALRINPNNEDAQYNLAIANTYVQDKIDAVPVFFLKRWTTALRSGYSSNVWAVWSIVFFALTLACVIVYLLMHGIGWRKAGFFGGIVAALLFTVTLSFAARQRREFRHPSEAVVMQSAVPVKGSPDAGSKDVFVLHEGTKVKIVSSLNDWREIRVADGNRGWLQVSAIEMID